MAKALLTAKFENLGEYEKQWQALSREIAEPFNKEFAYLIKQYSDSQQLVPRRTGNLQDTAQPLDEASVEYDGRFAYITYPAYYAPYVWFGVHMHFNQKENINAQAKWLEPIFQDTKWIQETLAKLFKKHTEKKGAQE